jgi:DNA-binding MarR family transcriptional regulator
MARKASKDTSKSRPERSTEPVVLGREAAAGFTLWREAMRWQRSVNGALRSFGLTHSQFLVLSSLDRACVQEDDAVSQRQVAREAGLDDATTSSVLQTLQARSLVDRAPAFGDGRSWRVIVTNAGARMLRRASPLVSAAGVAFQAGAAEPKSPRRRAKAAPAR